MTEDPGFMRWALDGLGATAAAMVAVLWKSNSSAHEKHRETQIKLFEKIDAHEKRDEELFREVAKQMNESFSRMTETIHANHAEMLRAIPKRKDDL